MLRKPLAKADHGPCNLRHTNTYARITLVQAHNQQAELQACSLSGSSMDCVAVSVTGDGRKCLLETRSVFNRLRRRLMRMMTTRMAMRLVLCEPL